MIRKATANSRAVEERQNAEKLSRDKKSGGRALATLQGKHDELDSKQTTLLQDYETWKVKVSAVSRPSHKLRQCLTILSKDEENVTKLKVDLKNVKQELERNEAERTKIS